MDGLVMKAEGVMPHRQVQLHAGAEGAEAKGGLAGSWVRCSWKRLLEAGSPGSCLDGARQGTDRIAEAKVPLFLYHLLERLKDSQVPRMCGAGGDHRDC